MTKRRTNKQRRAGRQALTLRVTTPRIVWFGLLDWLGRGCKLLALAAALGGLVWAAALGLRRAFLENDDFRLREIALTPNRALDERRLVELTGIDLAGNLFAVEIDRVQRTLEALPELVSARVERQLPGTLHVRVAERQPIAWIESPAHGIAGRDPQAGLLIDAGRIVFPCVERMRPHAEPLPVVVLADPGLARPEAGRPLASAELERCLRLLDKALPSARQGGWTVARVAQANAWSLSLTTGDGVEAVFGLGDHDRQLADFAAVLAHTVARGQRLATINLIPERNIPATLHGEAPPRAIPVEEDYLPPLPPEGPLEAAPPAGTAADPLQPLRRG
jgi:hypothetical protein